MFQTFLPPTLDNAYRGKKIALWLFGLLILVRTAMGVNSIVIGESVASHADGIPLETFTPAGAHAVVSMFAIWGLAQLVICLLCTLALLRYRRAIPFLFALLLTEHLTRKLILHLLPIAKRGAPPASFVNLTLLAVTTLGLLLSLWPRLRTKSQL